jgi:hypothetical protein
MSPYTISSWRQYEGRGGHRHHRVHVVLFIDGIGVFLHPHEENRIMTDVTVGHKIALSIGYLDTAGNPMVVTPTPDAPPVWTQTTPATETLVAATDGLTATATAVAAGSDTISLALAVGGQQFTASLAVTVTAAPQVLGSIVINAVVQ